MPGRAEWRRLSLPLGKLSARGPGRAGGFESFVQGGEIAIQERFWAQMERVDPVSYIAMGDLDVVVSKRREFIENLRAGA